MNTISVILPTAATVARLRSLNCAIESVLSQQDVTVDLIVVANGPRCDPEILDSVAKRSDVRLVYAEEGSYPAALRLGRGLVDAPFFAEIDDDDKLLPMALATRLHHIELDPTVDVVITNGILRRDGRDTTTIVLAGHGMTTKRGAQFMLHEILVRLKLAAPAEPALHAPTPLDTVDSWLAWGWQHMPWGARQLLKPVRDRLRGWIDEPAVIPAPRLDAANSKCFLVENHFAVGAIRLNLVGREPSGKVQPGAEADALCAELKRDLLDLRDLNTGKQVISDVVLTRDLYRGEHLDDLPDVLVVWGPDMPLGTAVVGKPGNGKVRLGSKKIDLIEGENRYCRTGEHRPDGLFIANGPGLAPGTLNRTVSILDFAPTITRLLDVDLPDVDGEAIREIFERPGGNADGRDTPR